MKIKVVIGKFETKHEAYNAGAQAAEGAVLMTIADDLLPTHVGYEGVVFFDMATNFPDLDGILHYPDGLQNANLCTHPVMGRKYFQRFGYLVNPAYKSQYADNELTEVARRLGRIKYLNTRLFHHDHPLLGHRKADALNFRDRKCCDEDARTYKARAAQGFPHRAPTPLPA